MKWIPICICFITYSHFSLSQDCTDHFIKNECKIDMVCHGISIGQLRSSNLHVNTNSFCWDNEHLLSNPSYYNERVLPIYLQLVDITSPTFHSVPNFYDSNLKQYIYSLDLSSIDQLLHTPTLTSMPNLVQLRISNNTLITAKLYNEYPLSAIRELDLSYNVIRAIEVNRGKNQYTTLTKIDLSHNNITVIPDGIFYGFDKLEIINLSFNLINVLTASTFEGVRNLLELDLGDNKLTDLNSSLFRFSKLKTLNLKINKIKNISPNDFDVMNNLESLDLSFNLIQSFNISVFRHTVSLIKITVAHNLLENIEKDSFTYSKYLTEVDISNNKLKSLPIGLFANMSITNFAISDNHLQGSLEKGMLDGINVKELNFENQYLTAIEDFAFENTNNLEVLLLNSNKIETLSDMCFKALRHLEELNLSYNHIVNISFSKIDLKNLRKMLLRGNHLIQITRKDLQELTSLEYLDLEENFITHIEPGSFKHLRNLMNLALNSNPLNGTLQTSSFEGLTSLPQLDLAGNLLTMIYNASFSGMGELKHLNVSRAKIIEIQYNAFIHTGFIEILDLSWNSLDVFYVNLTELISLNVLLLNNNNITTLTSITFKGLYSLTRLDVSYNNLQSIANEALSDQVDMRDLNLSFNENVQIADKFTYSMKHLQNIDMSGIKTGLNVSQFKDVPVSVAKMTNANIRNLTKLNVNCLGSVVMLVLNNNKISRLEIGVFAGMHVLNDLDLSCNDLNYIQPGVFKDTASLVSLNISHNDLLSVSYGIFRGLTYLNTLDLSYNNISDLQNERFYELKNLSVLIADHNRIVSIDFDEFEGTSLTELSIGDNPLPCKDLINFKKREGRIHVTALSIDENNYENFQGIKCNRNVYDPRKILPKNVSMLEGYTNNNLLSDIRNILYNLDSKTVALPNTNDEQLYIEKISDDIQKSNALNTEKLSNITSALLSLANNNNNNLKSNNILLEKIVNSLQDKRIPVTQPSIVTSSFTESSLSDNETESLIKHVNKMKNELQLMFNDKINNIKHSIDEIKTKLTSNPYDTAKPKNERFVSENGQRSIFTEACVAIILIILVCTLLYKFYKSRVYIRNRLSISTRELPGAIDNSNL